jgi:hypothetical protein
MFAALAASGLSIAAFTKRHGVTAQRYYYWRAKIAESIAVEARRSTDSERPLVREVRLVQAAMTRDDSSRESHDGSEPIVSFPPTGKAISRHCA